jgi:hypothetical protein
MSIKSLGLTDEQLALWEKVLSEGAKTSLESLGLVAKTVGSCNHMRCSFGGRQRDWHLVIGCEDAVHKEVWNWMFDIVFEEATKEG